MMNAIAETANTVTSTSSSFSAHFDFTTVLWVVAAVGVAIDLFRAYRSRRKA